MECVPLLSSSGPLWDMMNMTVRIPHASAVDEKAMKTLIWNEHGFGPLNGEDEQIEGRAIPEEKSHTAMKRDRQREKTPVVITWTTCVTMPLPPLPKELVELVLPDGCSMPAQALLLARMIRTQVILSLWPLIQGDVIRELAFVICVNSYADAWWWIRADTSRSQETVMKQLTMLLAWRSPGILRGAR